MKTLIIYDSFFGNTEKIAQAMGSALVVPEGCEVIKVNHFTPEKLKGIELLVVGSPTRGFRPSDGSRAFITGLAVSSLKGIKVVAFDTRIKVSDIRQPVLRFFLSMMGYAAKPIAGGLVRKGGSLVAEPEGYFVKASEGPLYEGELERAAAWIKGIASA